MIVDASALLAVLMDETMAAWVIRHMSANVGQLRMSTMNLAETLAVIHDREPTRVDAMEQVVFDGSIRYLPVDVAQARIVAKARQRFSINFGDCFAYALAIQENCPILTLDAEFKQLDCKVFLPPS